MNGPAITYSEAKVLDHAQGGGHYLMCQCAWCALQTRFDHVRHLATCKRIYVSAECRYHSDTRCHCDCRRKPIANE